eukprot:Rhum_TRINITY_DN14440_c1_g1::Rhum_TRINITY_DN14440_c1_g1_i1::g.90620::m.90620/K18764/CCRN4L; nocturnin
MTIAKSPPTTATMRRRPSGQPTAQQPAPKPLPEGQQPQPAAASAADVHHDGTAVYGRVWQDHSEGRGDHGLPTVRVMQWNILADSLAKGSDDEFEPYESEAAGQLPGQRWVGWGRAGPPDDYQRPHVFRCSERWLAWAHRGPRVVNEIKRLSPDIVALQEVDQWAFLREGLPEYDGTFAAKTGFEDGVALLWRKPWVGGACRVFRFSRGAQVALAQRLLLPAEAAAGGAVRAVVAVSMHLKAGFSGRYEATRENQLHQLSEAVRDFAEGDAVVILADLNAHPTDLAGLPAQALPLVLKKGYASAYPPDSFTVWSGWTDGEVRAAFDHVLFTATALRCKKTYALPPLSAISSEPCRLPNHRWPSDHLPLACDLLLRQGLRREAPGDVPALDTITLESAHQPSHHTAAQGRHHGRYTTYTAGLTPHGYAPAAAADVANVTTSSLGISVCKYFAHGSCHYAQMCKLPHSDGRRGERCYFFDTGQQCRHESGCHFLHSSAGSPPATHHHYPHNVHAATY